MKLLHSADWHLDSPLQGRDREQTAAERKALLSVPGRISALCREERCDLMLLSGDLFDGPYTRDSYQAVYRALEEAGVPVYIAPGNHDPIGPDSPWIKERWPGNVFIFTRQQITRIEGLGYTVYGGAFTGAQCPGLLETLRGEPGLSIGVFHGDPTQTDSPYCPVTRQQVARSNLTYLALGHIHKGGQFVAGSTLCAWPGCPMGRGYDEQGEKGVLIVTLEGSAQASFRGLGLPRFYEISCTVRELEQRLPPVGNEDHYRVTLTGEGEPVDLEALRRRYGRFPNLELRDETRRPVDPWAAADTDSFEGFYFRLLRQSMEGKSPEEQRRIRLAAQISRRLLDGQEVELP